MKKLTGILAFAVLCVSNTVIAQISAEQRTELRKLSHTMFLDGNPNYLELDAICDGLLQPNTHYKLGYTKGGSIMLNDAALPEDYSRHYGEKMKQFLERENATNISFSTLSDGVDLVKDLKPTSEFMTRRIFPRGVKVRMTEPGKDKGPMDAVVEDMAQKKMLKMTGAYEITYNASGLFLNNKKLSRKQTDYYAAILAREGFSLKGESDEISVRHMAETGKKSK